MCIFYFLTKPNFSQKEKMNLLVFIYLPVSGFYGQALWSVQKNMLDPDR